MWRRVTVLCSASAVRCRRNATAQTTTERFWDWCARHGVTSKRLSIGSSSRHGERGLFLEESCGEGAVLLSIPFGLCLNRELLMLSHGTWCRSIVPIAALQQAARRFHVDAGDGCEHMWLSLALRKILMSRTVGKHRNDDTHHPEVIFEPYAAMLPSAASLEMSRSRALQTLRSQHASDVEEAFMDIQAQVNRSVRITARVTRHFESQLRRRNRMITGDNQLLLPYCHDLVISRCVELPVGCTRSVPDDLPTLLEKHPRMPVLPTLIPVLDMINAAEPAQNENGDEEVAGDTSNCAVFTTVARREGAQEDGNSVKTRVVPGELLSRRRVVVCATRPLQSGTELLLPYDVDDVAASAFRYGMVLATPKSS